MHLTSFTQPANLSSAAIWPQLSILMGPELSIQAFCLLLCACITLALTLAGASSRSLCCLVLYEGRVSTSCQALNILS